MATISNGMLVRFHFKMYSPEGDILADTGEEPTTYIHGMMQTDPEGLCIFLEGKETGYSGKTIIEKAFGPSVPRDEALQRFPKEQLGGDVQKGMMFAAQIPGKGDIPMTVMDIQGDDVIVLMGHPLAGYDISFDIEIVEVRPHTQEDIDELRRQFGG